MLETHIFSFLMFILDFGCSPGITFCSRTPLFNTAKSFSEANFAYLRFDWSIWLTARTLLLNLHFYLFRFISGFPTPGGRKLASIHTELENKIATLMFQWAYGGEDLEVFLEFIFTWIFERVVLQLQISAAVRFDGYSNKQLFTMSLITNRAPGTREQPTGHG